MKTLGPCSLLLLALACAKDPPPSDPPAPAVADDGGAADGADADGADAADAPSPDPAPSDGGATVTAGSKAAGDSCLAASECASGVCEGEGCADDRPGTCTDAERMCTRDLRQYCGCDGKSFGSSGSCPGQRYAHKDPC